MDFIEEKPFRKIGKVIRDGQNPNLPKVDKVLQRTKILDDSSFFVNHDD